MKQVCLVRHATGNEEKGSNTLIYNQGSARTVILVSAGQRSFGLQTVTI